MPINIAPRETLKVESGIRIYPYNAPWIYATNTQFRFESGTDAMSYVNSNDLVYFGQVDLTNLVEVRVQYAREGGSSPSFKFYTEADNTGKPVKELLHKEEHTLMLTAAEVLLNLVMNLQVLVLHRKQALLGELWHGKHQTNAWKFLH